MTLTKAQARTAIREAIDDPNAKRWSDINLDALTARVIDSLWSDVLDQAPWILSSLETPPLTAPGFIDLRTTTSGGQLTQRFFRIQKVIRGGREYEEAKQSDTLIESNVEISTPNFSFTLYSNQLWLFPLDTTNDVEFRYNFLPQSYTALADATQVPWADGYDDAYIYSVARRAMAKGDAESIAQVSSLANESLTKLLVAIRKSRIGPTAPAAFDSPHNYGGI